MKIKEDMLCGAVHLTENYGSIEIIEYINANRVKIRFKNTGSLRFAKSCHIRTGKVRDLDAHPDGYEPGSVIETKFNGKIEIIKYKNYNNVSIRFLNTGLDRVVTKSEVERGMIRDFLAKTYCGIGYLGVGKFKTEVDKKATPEYIVWSRMIDRCYRKDRSVKNKSYIDCTVCDEWHCFQTFAKWYEENYPSDGLKYYLDKDIKVKGNRVYSPETCMFVTALENAEQAHAISGSFVSPSGSIHNVFNINKFCRENKLNSSCMLLVLRGKQSHHKGWTKA